MVKRLINTSNADLVRRRQQNTQASALQAVEVLHIVSWTEGSCAEHQCVVETMVVECLRRCSGGCRSADGAALRPRRRRADALRLPEGFPGCAAPRPRTVPLLRALRQTSIEQMVQGRRLICQQQLLRGRPCTDAHERARAAVSALAEQYHSTCTSGQLLTGMQDEVHEAELHLVRSKAGIRQEGALTSRDAPCRRREQPGALLRGDAGPGAARCLRPRAGRGVDFCLRQRPAPAGEPAVPPVITHRNVAPQAAIVTTSRWNGQAPIAVIPVHDVTCRHDPDLETFTPCQHPALCRSCATPSRAAGKSAGPLAI